MTFNKTLLTLLFVSALPVTVIAGMENAGDPPPPSGRMQVDDAKTGKWGPADAQVAIEKENKHLLDAMLQLAAANEWCRLAFSDLNRYRPLGAQKRDDLQGCLWARYATEQAAEGKRPLSRAGWLEKTQLDARAADSQLVAAWQYPRTVKGPQ
ncbi:hypothetical protein [Pantoea sp. PNA 03-3]|uniref:hypothetical protein n=1 Tax=Pantoea sp. PNA 03-3 TaxID=2135460 RepID=UPI000D765D42|nr:hypothetical protein [Pantoea sp. PNA 03-3]PXV70908.1 hypothetical protein C7433_11450 [Pantoea sp. PNA 03-3]